MKRAGAIPFKVINGVISVLFVTSQTRGRWVLPKGSIKTHERAVQACQREVYEEAGVRGIPFADRGIETIVNKKVDDNLKPFDVTFYPLLVTRLEEHWPEMDQRSRRWIPLAEARQKWKNRDHESVLNKFEKMVPELTKLSANS